MAFTTIAKVSDHFDCPIWAGSDSTTTVTGMGFKPDSLWIKRYDGSGHPVLNNSSLGTAKNWIPSGNNAVNTTVHVASYTSDGFTLTGDINDTNDASQKYMASCWKANGGTTASNSDGGTTSTVQANTTAGFSIVNWTGTGGTTTLGHGLGVAPKFIIAKNNAEADRGVTLNMSTLYESDPATDNMQFALNGTTLQDQADRWGDTAPTSTVFTVGGTGMINGSSDECFAYCFAEVQGFSKFGYYSGTGNAQGTKVYCGFRPKWILIKNRDSAENWFVKSTVVDYGQLANDGELKTTLKFDDNTASQNCTVNAESNGFRLATTDGKANGEDVKYLYMAFAEMPMVGTNGTVALAI
tara:strand:+ start:203 stop:1264 length:1062 start_codon:yes stop_codon:yes gene_type:complete